MEYGVLVMKLEIIGVNKEMKIEEEFWVYNYVMLVAYMVSVLDLSVMESPGNNDILVQIQIQVNYKEKENSIK